MNELKTLRFRHHHWNTADSFWQAILALGASAILFAFVGQSMRQGQEIKKLRAEHLPASPSPSNYPQVRNGNVKTK